MRIPIHRVFRGPGSDQIPRRPRGNARISNEIADLLSQPTWSVRSLLPPTSPALSSSKDGTTTKSESAAVTTSETADGITREKLHHLLRLSALPLPKSEQEESRMLKTLRDQVHFVKAIQSIDTAGIEPLVTIRDETPEAIREQTITLETMKPYLELEEKVGRNGTVRRREVVRTTEQDRQERSTWEVDVSDLGEGSQERRKGRFFYVKRDKERTKVKEVAGRREQETLNRPEQTGLS